MQHEKDFSGRCLLGGGGRAMNPGMWAAMETVKGKETDSPLKPPEGVQPC